MSAQDDVLAAFGEPPRKTKTQTRNEADGGIQAGDAADGDAARDDAARDDAARDDESGGDAAASDAAAVGDAAASDAAAVGDAAASDAAAVGDVEVAFEEQVGGDGGPAEVGASKQVAEAAEDGTSAQAAASEQAAESGHAGTAAEAGEAAESEPVTETRHAGPAPEAAAGEQLAEASDAGASAQTAVSEPGNAGTVAEAGESEQAAGEQAAEPSAPAIPAQPYLDPAAFFAQLQAEAAPTPQRRWPRLALRYGSALVVAGALGVGTAYAVTLPRRTDVPFLATPSDGRYSFPGVVHPVPPAGEAAPGADSNQTQAHYGDLRQYLVPAPVGAVPKESGWESVADFENSLSGNDVSAHLYDAGVRRVAWRGWVAVDGQHTVVELVQFPDHEAAFSVASLLDGASLAKASGPESVVPLLTLPSFGVATSTAALHKFDQVSGLPGQVERRVVFQSGDVVAVVTSTAPRKVPDTPTEQVALLEAAMLR
ncbi:hypothetical protein ABH926_008961 [Catenulispora sp. GP43]|uniref:hypothetical protein n=1 Tax=Catenulispora sp. GP43 TaxID=3156263 RepID=UPI00351329DB